MALKTRRFDAADFLTESETMAEFVRLSFEEDEIDEIVEVLGTVARAEGMTEIARRTGLSRESLYRSLTRGGNPELTTVLRVLDALDLRLSVVPKAKVASAKGQRAPAASIRRTAASRSPRSVDQAGPPTRKAARKATVGKASPSALDRTPRTRATPSRKLRGKAVKPSATRHR